VSLLRRLVVPLLTATVALVALLALRPLSTSRALAIWVVIVTGLALLLLVRHSQRNAVGRGKSSFEAALRPRTRPAAEPVELLRMQRELELGIAGAGYAHSRLLPLLRGVAATRLSSRHGIELERRPDAAREALGEEAWKWLRPDRPEPADRFDRGIPRDQLAHVIATVESL
jgi:hypothetical protein